MDYMMMLRNGYQAPVAGGHTMQHQHQHQHAHQHQHQHFTHSSQGHPGYGYHHGYTNEQLYVMAQLHQQRAAMMGHGGMSASKQAEPKPRLSKDEVDLLEREFQKNSKPSSGRKREIAELLKVDHPRINNWFQNRRAKEKQMKKLKEFNESQQAAEMSTSEPDSPEDSSLQASSAAFPGSDPASPLEDEEVDFSIKEETSPTSETTPYDSSAAEVSPISCDGPNAAHDADAYPSPRSLPFQSVETVDMGLKHLTSQFVPSQPEEFSQPSEHHSETPSIPRAEFETAQQVDATQSFNHFSSPGNYESIIAPTPAFPSQLVAVEAAAHGFEASAEPNGLPVMDSPTHSSSPSIAEDMRFKSPPPPANLASRRNRGIPGELSSTALRSYSYGPKTGLEMPKRSDTASPMRRIASATGTIPHRIQKASLGAAPRSPLYIERTKEALMRSLQGGRSPILHSLNTALSPVTSHDGHLSLAQGTREATVSSSASDDEQRYTLGGAQHQASFFMKTPPTTPGLGRNFPEQMIAIDSAWNYVPTDEPLITPGLGSFGSEEFTMAPSVPSYVVNSQPATPSYPSSGVGPNYFPFSLNGAGPSHTEYTFPGESYALSDTAVRLSPTQSKSKQFQFTQNVTPQDYSVEK